MKKNVLVFAFAVVLSLLALQRPAGASSFTESGEAYVYPTFSELTQMTVMLGGVDVKDSQVLREYIRLMYCDLYRTNIDDEFAWHEIEEQIRARIASKKEYYRSLYQLDGVVKLGAYDFKTQQFPLIDSTAFQNVGYMSLFSENAFMPYCPVARKGGPAQSSTGGVFSKNINIVLSEPFNFTAFKATPERAKELIAKFEKLGDAERKLYIRFRFRVQSIARADKGRGGYVRTVLSGEIVSIDLFWDKEMTKWMMSLPLR